MHPSPPKTKQWTGHPIANDPCYGGELHFGDPAAKRRAEENPASEGWQGVAKRSTEALNGHSGDVVRQPGTSSEASESGAGAEVAVGGGGDWAVTGSSSTQQPGATSSPATHGALPGAATVPSAARDNASAAAAAAAVPGDDAGARRDGEDEEAFMVIY